MTTQDKLINRSSRKTLNIFPCSQSFFQLYEYCLSFQPVILIPVLLLDPAFHTPVQCKILFYYLYIHCYRNRYFKYTILLKKLYRRTDWSNFTPSFQFIHHPTILLFIRFFIIPSLTFNLFRARTYIIPIITKAVWAIFSSIF